MNKKYLIVGIAIVVILIILFVSVIFSQKSPAQQQAVSKATSSTKQSFNALYNSTASKNTTAPTVTLPPPANTPQAAVEQFYHYYFSSRSNPLANGAYKNNPDLAPDFKGLIEAAYDNGNTPVFCLNDEQKNIVVGQEVPVDYNDATVMEETISDASGGKNLYTVFVQNVNNKWLIYDIHCL